jgi:hypothetical protein
MFPAAFVLINDDPENIGNFKVDADAHLMADLLLLAMKRYYLTTYVHTTTATTLP